MKHPYFTTAALDQRIERETVQTEVNAFIQKSMEARIALKGRRVLVAC